MKNSVVNVKNTALVEVALEVLTRHLTQQQHLCRYVFNFSILIQELPVMLHGSLEYIQVNRTVPRLQFVLFSICFICSLSLRFKRKSRNTVFVIHLT